MGHFAREWTKPKKVRPNPSSPNYFLCPHIFLANSLLGWIVDTGATKHVTRDRAGFVDYHRVPAFNHYIATGNGAQEEVLRIGSYQLKLSTGRQEKMARLAREGLLGSLAKVNLPTCEPCMAEKACRKPFGKAKRATHPLELVHSDMWGTMNVGARHGAFYFLTFIDDYSRYGSVYLLSHRSEALDCFKRFLAEVENQREVNLKVFRTDRGREYLSEQFKKICDKRIIRQLMIPYTPQKWGCREEESNTSENARSMMVQANLPISFWGDAILTTACILNRVPSKSIPTTPYELWHGRKPNLEGLRPWGSAGMTEIESRDVDFLEDFPSISEVKGNLELYELRDPQGGASITIEGESPNSYPVIDGDNESDPKLSGSCSLEEHNSQNPQMRRSKRGGIPRHRYVIEGESFMCASVDIDEPATYEEAVTSPNANEWITAMKEEMSSMAKNNVWELVDLPAGRKTIGNKWVLKVKRNADGSIDKFKARLVAKGYTQREGIDYEETFSPVVRFASVRLILAIVVHLDLELFQMNVKTAFLNGELDEEIYMDQPEGFTMVEEDHCVHVKRSEKNFMILSLYVDDILLTENNMEMIVATKKWLSSTFEMKDMGEAEYIIGVKIHRDCYKNF
ncbi:UNVERIFIED_CONTAM: Retrovirus-related Pol polyprotein from transposon TNT 1-94 [Sesamum latifolium]|uniref:Retrovirus-related Pol polyprotein from transposon TNT 1-94 n=1 Tax=Sesamum latifolium TaxID=2727402 RepID=A0AAW2TMK6_9LAMI